MVLHQHHGQLACPLSVQVCVLHFYMKYCNIQFIFSAEVDEMLSAKASGSNTCFTFNDYSLTLFIDRYLV